MSEGREGVDVPEGEVDLPTDEVHHLGDGEERHRGGELGDDAQVVRR